MQTRDESGQGGTLLRRLCEVGPKLHDVAMVQHTNTFGTLKDDARWTSVLPLRFDIQIRHLFTTTLDAYGLAMEGLCKRASPSALGALRLLAETYVTLAWLVEEPDASARHHRGMRLLLSSIRRTEQQLARSRDPTLQATAASLSDLRSQLLELSEVDGIPSLGEAPDRMHLFTRYLGDYSVFWTLSEIGSHPGPHYLLAFHTDLSERVVNVRMTGAELERAYFVASADELLNRTCEAVGPARGWEEWLVREWRPLIDTARPLMTEAQRLWGEKMSR